MNQFRYFCHFMFIGLILFTTGVTSLIISYSYNEEQCVKINNLTSVNYNTWLQIYGWTCIVGLVVSLVISAFYKITESRTIKLLLKSIIVLNILFHFWWYVFGSIIFFNEIEINCDNSLNKFGLGLFIIETFTFLFIYCFYKKVKYDNREYPILETTRNYSLMDEIF